MIPIRTAVFAVIAATAVAAHFPRQTHAQDARAAIAEASRAMGTGQLHTLQFEATGYDFVLGQAYKPDAPWPRFFNKSYTRAINYDARASRVARVRTQAENPPRGGGQQPVRGDQPQNQTIVIGPRTPWVQQLEILMTPHGFLKAAATAEATLASRVVNGRRYQVVSFMGDNKAPVNGYINGQHLIERVDTRIDNALFGDMLFTADYSNYSDVNGIKIPMRIVQSQAGFPIFDLTVSRASVNTPVTITAPAPPPGGGGPPAAAAAGTASEMLGDGVHLITGGYASLAVEFKDYALIIEGPQSEARGIAVIEATRRLIPNKPIRYVVNTHNHIDHASGLRPFVAEGISIVTHAVNKAWYERVLALPHTLAPDRLSQSARKPVIEVVRDKKVISDGTRTIELYHVKDSGHNEGLLIAYLPKEQILVEADGYNPPAQADAPVPLPISPYTANLVENVKRLRLAVASVVSIHLPADGRRITNAELLRAAGHSQ